MQTCCRSHKSQFSGVDVSDTAGKALENNEVNNDVLSCAAAQMRKERWLTAFIKRNFAT
jgi:hypothetical protein